MGAPDGEKRGHVESPDNTAMDALVLWLLLAGGFWMFKRHDEQQRIVLLSGFLRQYRLEERMAQLTDGYLRALGETDPERAGPIWRTRSPCGASILMTSSPISPRFCEAKGPMSTEVRSMTRTPCNGPPEDWFSSKSFLCMNKSYAHMNNLPVC